MTCSLIYRASCIKELKKEYLKGIAPLFLLQYLYGTAETNHRGLNFIKVFDFLSVSVFCASYCVSVKLPFEWFTNVR